MMSFLTQLRRATSFTSSNKNSAGRNSLSSKRCRVETLEDRRLLSAAPVLDPIADVTMGSGTAFYLNLEATDPDVLSDGSGERLTFSAAVSDTTLVTEIPGYAENRSLRLNIDSPGNSISGSMEFQLFEEIAPRTTGHIASLVESGFYDDVTFHRVIDEFMIQSGDPTATGSGGSDLGDFDDEFSFLQMHTVPGLLSMAKSNDDTNDSQFFITEIPTRWLDFNHSVFGYLTDGEGIREAISGVTTDAGDKPVDDVTITSAELFTDYEDGVLILQAPEGFTGDVDVTITVDDGSGGTAQRTFTVTVEADTASSDPYLGEIDPIEVTAGSSTTVTLPAFDVDGGGLYFNAQVWPENADITFTMDNATGELTVNVAEGVGGIHGIYVGVVQDVGSNWDTQMVPILVTPASPNTVSVSSDPGDPVELLVQGTCEGGEVRIYEGDQLIGQATAQGETVTIADTAGLSDGPHLLTVRQTYTETSTVGNNEYTGTFESPSSQFVVVVGGVTPQLTVTTLDDTVDLADGETSLREAIAYAGLPGDDTITFDPALFASGAAVLTLQLGEIELADAAHGRLTIEGPGADLLTVDAGGESGVFVVHSDVVAGISGMTITGGSGIEGGAVANDGGAVALDAVILVENDALYGGAVSCYQGTTTIANSTLRANSAEYGGGVLNDSGTLILNNVRFEGNVGSYGGGMYCYAADTTVNNGVFVGNSAQYGGGLVNDSGTLLLNNSTVTANAAAASGGGLLNTEGTLTATNSIVALNTAVGSLPNLYGDLSEQSASNLVETDPLFAANPSAGADEEWGTDDDDYGDLTLTVGSPAINTGDAALLPEDIADLDDDGDTAEAIPVDVFASPRIQGGTPDIGATEFYVEAIGDLDGDGEVGSSDLDIIRANWGESVTPWDVTQGDASGDGIVSSDDLDILRANWGWGRTAVAAATAEETPQTAAQTADEPADEPAGPALPPTLSQSQSHSLSHSQQQPLSEEAARALAEATWADAVRANRSKTQGKDHAVAVDWVLGEGW